MNETIIITGVNGFVGEHVVDTFLAEGFDVVGIGYDASAGEKVREKLSQYIACNLLDPADVQKINLANVRGIVHLAGLSNVSESFDKPLAYVNDNVTMTYNLLNYCFENKLSGRILVISSGALYDPHQTLPLSESSATLENSPYAVGKLAVEHMTSYFRLRGLDAITVRPFNHIGPGQGPGFLIPDLFHQLKEAQASENKTISVGNLDTRRDYTDVRDIANAYKRLALSPSLGYGLYNVCTGRSLSGKELLEIMQRVMGVGDIHAVVDESKVRPTDIMDIYGDSSRISEETGWKPMTDIEQTVSDFVKSNSAE